MASVQGLIFGLAGVNLELSPTICTLMIVAALPIRLLAAFPLKIYLLLLVFLQQYTFMFVFSFKVQFSRCMLKQYAIRDPFVMSYSPAQSSSHNRKHVDNSGLYLLGSLHPRFWILSVGDGSVSSEP